jgi:formyltetrahydrofolate deformylase
VTRISHRDDVDGSIRKGRDLERVVLGRAVRFHLEGGSSYSGTRHVVVD